MRRRGRLALKPANVSFEDAAAVPVAGVTALQAMRKAGVRPGHAVLVDGASGGVGTFVVQIARAFGANVTAVCSTAHVAAARSIGADRVIDYPREDFAAAGNTATASSRPTHRSILDYRRALGRYGIHVIAGGGMRQIFQSMLLAPVLSRFGRRKLRLLMAKLDGVDLALLAALLAAGKIVPVIDRRHPLRDVADAIRYLEAGHASGKVVITVA